MNSENIPESLGEVMRSVQDTVLQLWADFINRLPFIVAGLFILLITWFVVFLAVRFAAGTLRRSRMRGSLQELIQRLIGIGIWIIGIMVAAVVLFPGLTPARALGAMGIISIAVGFAFKDIFENFFAGVLLLWRFPFENGDFIECESIRGRVESVTVRMTQIRKTSGELVVVPNSFLFMNPVQILTNLDRRRVTIIAGVAYGEDVAQAVQVIEQAVRICKTVRQDLPVQIFPQAFGSSSIDIEVTWWTGPQPVDIRRSRGEVVTAVKHALDEAGIEIPFPYRTLTFKEPLKAHLITEQQGGSIS
jgi:small conductance mechanosensitive channel